MLETFPFSLMMGTVMGFLSGIGVGGGSLLILWLTLVLGWEQEAARNLNLLFFLPAAAVSCFYRWRQGAVEFSKILPAVAAGCIAAVLGNWASKVMDTNILKRLFGILLIVTGIRELLYKPKASP